MTEGNFTDYVKITVKSGKGGNGSVHLRREKYVEKGGPDGGNGGRGGNIIVRGNSQFWTLYHFKFKRHFKAENGGDGGKQTSSGKSGKDIIIEVPVGTIIKGMDTNEKITEIINHNQSEIILKGGKGGKGNVHYKSSVRQTPRYAQNGQNGIEKSILLELKVLADIGLIGFPNAGKSTLLSVLTAAKPKIANYEFTTLRPNLGIVKYRDFQTYTISDIPGLIEGASGGKGLGHYFLRHVERNAVLLFLISIESKDILREYEILINELVKYEETLLNKNHYIAITKSDLVAKEDLHEKIELINTKLGKDNYIVISSVSQENILLLKDKLWQKLNNS